MAASVRAVFPTGTGATTGATSPITTSVTVVSGDVLEAHVTVSVGVDTGMSVSATANGVAADGSSVIHSNGQTAGFEQVFYWLTPSAGTYNVVATVTGGTPDAIGQKCYAISGSDQSAPAVSTFAPSGTGNNTALSITSPTMPTGSVGISHFCAGGAFSSTGQTTQLNQGIGGTSAANSMAGASAAGAGATVAFTATQSPADWYGAIVTVWSQAGGGGGGPTEDPNQAAHWLARPPGHLTPATGFPGLRGKAKAPPIPPSPPFFTSWVDGVTPDLIVSAEDWGLLANGGLNHGGSFTATYTDYFSTRQGQGYNSILTSLFGYTDLSGAPQGTDSDGTNPFTPGTDPTTAANSTFWARRDAFLSTAATYGFRVFLNVTTPALGRGAFTASWSNAQWSALGTFLGNRYASQANIMWMVGDDYFGTVDSGLSAFLTALRAAGANQPISIENYQETSSQQDIYNGAVLSWGDINGQYNFGYSYNVSYDVVEKMGIEANPLPYFWGDGFFLASGTTGLTDVQLMRRMIWWALSSGSKGFEFGDNDIWPWASTALAQLTSKTFYTAVVPAIAAYFRSLPSWHLLIADTTSGLVLSGRGAHAAAIVSGGPGTQYISDTDSYVTASRTPTGSLAVIYMSHASSITIDETVMVAGYTATWVDPKTCVATPTTPGPTYNSGSLGNNSDGQADWVLVLRAPASAQALPPQPARRRLFPALRRRGKVSDPVAAPAVVVTTQALPPQPVRDRLFPMPRRRWAKAEPPLAPQVAVTVQALPPQPGRDRLFPLLRRRPVATQVVVTVRPLPNQPVRDRLFPFPRRRQISTQPIPAPVVTVTTQALPPQPARRLTIPVSRRRGRTSAPVPPQVVIVTGPQALPPQPGRRRWGFLPRARARQAQPVPAQVVIVTGPQALPPQPARDRLVPFPRRRQTSTQPVRVTVQVTTQALPPQPFRDRLVPVPFRRGRARNVVPPQVIIQTTQALPPQPGRRRLRFLPRPRRAQATQLFRVYVVNPNDGVPVRNPGLTLTSPVPGLTLTVRATGLTLTSPVSRLELT